MIAVVQLRSEIDTSAAVRDTLEMLHLGNTNRCTFVPETESYRGMITKVNDWVAHGEPSRTVVATLLRRRGEPAEGDADVDDTWIAEHTAYDDVEALAEALLAEETTLAEQGLSPSLRLHPPRGGHEGIKQPVVAGGGDLGPHDTADIDALLEAMR